MYPVISKDETGKYVLVCQVPKSLLDDVPARLPSQAWHLAEDPILTVWIIQGVDPVLVQQIKDGKRHSRTLLVHRALPARQIRSAEDTIVLLVTYVVVSLTYRTSDGIS